MANYPLGIDVIIKGIGGLSQVEKAVNRIDKQGASLASTFRIVRGAFIALGGTAVVGSLINIAVASEKARLSLNALTGSAVTGGKAFETASDFAKKFGFSQQQALQATQELLRVGGLENLNKNLEQAAGISRSFGIDLKTAADQLAIAKEQGIGSSKQLYEGLKTQYGKIVDTVKDSATLSGKFLEEVLGPGSPAQKATIDGADGIAAAFERLKQSFASFGLEVTGTDYAGNINALAKAVEYATENVKKLEIALGLLLLAIPGAGWIRALTGVGLVFDGIRRDMADNRKEAENLTNTVVDGSIKMSQNLGAPLEAVKRLTGALSLSAVEAKKTFSPTEPTYYQQVLAGVSDAWKEIDTQQAAVAKMTKEVVLGAYSAVGNEATKVFTAIITGSMSARDAGRSLANVILNEVVGAFVRLFIVAPIMAYLKTKIDEIIGAEKNQKSAIDDTNRSLTRQIGLRLALMALGFADGGAVQAGGQPMQRRANGGPTAGNMPYLVGERGPEMFVPNTDGYIVPNDKLNMGDGSAYGMSSPGNMNITFNINTVDARDFDTLLMTRQDMIIGMINKGLYERGKRSLV